MKQIIHSLIGRLPILFFISFMIVLILYNPALSNILSAWEEGPYGYEYALLVAEKEEIPSILYLYVEPSRWCDKFNKEYLEVSEVEKFLNDFPKTAINTNNGDAELKISNSFDVVNFPAFFVLMPSFNVEPQRIHPFSQKGNLSVSEFLQRLKDIMTSRYNKEAYSYYEDKDFENALKYFEMSLDFDPEKAYTYFAIGSVYHYLGIDNKDKDTLLKAEEYYLKALEIEPDHRQTKNELVTLRKDMENM